MDLVETRELGYFVAVAEELHFGRAAARLGMTQPPLSRAVRRLERRMGVTLLLRTSRQVALTAAGEVLLRDGRKALQAVDGAVRRAQRTGRNDPRLLLVCKAGADSGGLVADILDAYRDQPDALPVQVVHSATERIAMLRDGRVDVALLHRPSNDLTGLDTEDLRTEAQMVVLRPDHPLAGRAEVSLADLRGEVQPRWPESVPGPDAAGRPVIGDHADLIELVGSGGGVVVVPRSAIGVVPRRLACVPVRDAAPTTLVLAWPRESRSRAVAALARTAARVARGGGAGDQPIDGPGARRSTESADPAAALASGA
jgi:DNA-binding transcriptional LysR family regulator